MPDALLIFSLGPVQGFLAEARRAQDLWAGSQWLSDLARAAIRACELAGARVIYPADPGQASLPNKFVVQLPEAALGRATEAAKQAAQEALKQRADDARRFLQGTGVRTDVTWGAIWQRQTEQHLEFFWAAARMEGDYQATYMRASQAFEASKHTRRFSQVHEDGPKDSLGGRRSALRTEDLDARAYWAAVARSGRVSLARLKPDGRERLDALGAAKRFGFGDEADRFPSVSSIAVADFLTRALERAQPALAAYRQTLDQIPTLYKVSGDPGWPYDGDLLFIETLAPNRLRTSYGFDDADLQRYGSQLEAARLALRMLRAAGQPSPYYAILVMDGDGMGERVAGCASQDEHADLSRQLVAFAGEAWRLIDKAHLMRVVYAGGDDVLALLPLSRALPAAQALADSFAKTVPGSTASAGIALVHHLYPLDAALQEARRAEKQAKKMRGKNAVCVQVLKRSGEPIEVRSHWGDLGTLFEEVCRWFADGALSSRLAYEAAANLPVLKGEMVRSELKRLIRRHRDERKTSPPDPEELADRLAAWDLNLPGGAEELGRWLLLARFLAKGGGE